MSDVKTNDIKKWIKKSEKNIGFSEHDNYFLVDYENIQSKITKPTDIYQYYQVSPMSGTDYIWYDFVNRYCIEKNPREKDILAKIIKYTDKHIQDISNSQSNLCQKNIATNEIQHETQHDAPSDPLLEIDSNLEYYTLKSKLTKLSNLNNSSSNISVDGKVQKLYSDKIVTNMLIGEFLDLWKWSKSSGGVNIELLNDNIYIWRIQLSNFTNEELNKDLRRLQSECDVNYVELEFAFHDKFYPNYPPMIKITKPNLKDALGHRIANSKMTQLAYWTPTRGTQYLITRCSNILNRLGRVDFGNGIVKKQTSIVVSNMMSNLLKLSALIDTIKEDDEIDNDTQFIKFNIVSSKLSESTKVTQKQPNAKTQSTYWKSGTGYGHSGNNNWDPDDYVKLQKEKDKNISSVIEKILNDLQQINNTTSDFEEVCRIISNSLLLPYLKQQLKQSTLLEIQNRESLFRLIISLIETLSSEKSIYLFDIKQNGTCLYDILIELHSQLQGVIKIDKENEFIQLMSGTLDVIVFPMYSEYKSTLEVIAISTNTSNIPILENATTTTIPKNVGAIQLTDLKALYKEQLTKLRFDYVNILGQGFGSTSVVPNTSFKSSYVDKYKKEMSSANWRKCQKRLSIELPSLMQIGQLPIDYEASIFMRVDENNPMIIKALITGPHDTPYENGCFIFDLYTNSKYPENFTDCWFMNTGGNRLNPNLYNCGKVCLSILGTWGGQSKSESWNEKTSSLLQVLVSIQAQILIEEPEFNEPGHERHIGTSQGNAASIAYNNNIRYYTMCSTIRDLVKDPSLYPHFEDVIRLHFKLKKHRVLETCKKWVDESPANLKGAYSSVFNEIKAAIEKL